MLRLSTRTLPLALAVAAVALWSTESRGAETEEEKRACVAAADQGQLLRDGGDYAEAHGQFTSCAAERCPTIVRAQCGVWLRQLIDATPTVVFAATDAAGHDLANMRVMADGKRVAEVLDGRPVALNPGAHEFRFEALGREPVVLDVMLRAGDKNRAISVVAGELQRAEGPPSPPPPTADTRFWDGRTVTSLSLLIAGALSSGAGLYFAVSSRSDADRAAGLRQSLTISGCEHTGSAACMSLSDTVDTQSRDGALSTAFYISGGVLAAASAMAWFTWPGHANAKRSDRAAALSIRPIFGAGRAGVAAQIELQ